MSLILNKFERKNEKLLQPKICSSCNAFSNIIRLNQDGDNPFLINNYN